MNFTNKNRAGIISGIVASVLLSCAGPCFAQNVADAARQERERKQHATHRAYHIYTNEDLKRQHILLPEDQERAIEARRNSASPAYDANNNSAAPDASASASGIAPAQPSINGAPVISLLPFSLPQPQAFGEFAPALSAPLFAAKHLGPFAAPRVRRAHPLFDDLLIVELQKNQTLPAPPEFPNVPAPSHANVKQLVAPAHASVHAAQPTPAPGVSQTAIQVHRGDSLWKIAERNLGNGARWHEIAAINPEIADPNIIHVGDWIRVAPQETQSARMFIVQPGDTLSSLAQTRFGHASAFTCIASANPNLRSADMIFAGQSLVLPDSCPIAR
jgi:nucleoid-associated protein YgaU